MNIQHDSDSHPIEQSRASGAPATSRSPRWLLLGNSPAIRALRAEIARIAPMDATVLIAGEPGTWKELYAAEIHRRSGRSGPFVVVEPRVLMDDALRVDGPGNGAEETTPPGAELEQAPFDYANGGTIYITDVTELAPPLQARLLQILGADRSMEGAALAGRADVRVIAAASREPLEAVHDGRLREDLYDFLNDLTLHVPPLRARDEDVVPLAKAFLDTLNRTHGTARRLDEDAARALAMRAWPGNVRELRKIVEQSYEGADGFDAVLQIAGASGDGADDLALRAGVSVAAMERKLIELTLAHFHGDKRRSAAVLGISVRTLYNRLRQYRCEAARA
jgi:DNA-binding NtrC family response regulator